MLSSSIVCKNKKVRSERVLLPEMNLLLRMLQDEGIAHGCKDLFFFEGLSRLDVMLSCSCTFDTI